MKLISLPDFFHSNIKKHNEENNKAEFQVFYINSENR